MSPAKPPESSATEGPRYEQRSHLAWAPIADVAAARALFAQEHCSESEQAAVSGRHVQTLAGFIALKAAIVDLLSTEFPDVELARRDVELGHAEDGAPIVERLPVALPMGADGKPARLFVSITHTKEHAIGVATLERREEGG